MAKTITLKNPATKEIVYPITLTSNVYGANGTTPLSSVLYPIGSIYISTQNVSPASFFGGTWEQIKDTFLLTAGDTYMAGNTGGEATHTLAIDEMPSHKHDGLHWHNDMTSMGGSWDTGSGNGYVLTGSWKTGSRGGNNFKTAYAGGGQAFDIMPPYLVVYAWKRVS